MATYLILNLLFMSAVGLILLIKRVSLPSRPLIATITTVLFLTLIFNSIFIVLNIYDYNDNLRLPFEIINFPPEDLAYAIVAAVFVPYLWKIFEKTPNEK